MPDAQYLKSAKPELIAELFLYEAEKGGRRDSIKTGFGCPCSVAKDLKEGWDGYVLLGDEELRPGERREVGFVFLSGDQAVSKLRSAGKFYLWDGRFIGEAKVLA